MSDGFGGASLAPPLGCNGPLHRGCIDASLTWCSSPSLSCRFCRDTYDFGEEEIMQMVRAAENL